MGRKRKGETLKSEGNKKDASNAAGNDTSTTVAQSRLKRPRAPSDAKRAETAPTNADSIAKSEDCERMTLELQKRIETYLNCAFGSHFETRPDAELIFAVEKLLQFLPVHILLKRISGLPRVLLIAIRKGIANCDRSPRSPTTALVHCLIILAFGADVATHHDDTRVHTRRSAHYLFNQEKLTDMDLQALHKAGRWASQLLMECARGDIQERSAPHDLGTFCPVQHNDAASTFVSPRDVLDRIMSARYRLDIIQAMKTVVAHPGLSLPLKAGALQALWSNISAVERRELLVPILESGALALGAIDTAQQSLQSLPREIIPSDSINRAISNFADGLFHELSSPARCAVLRACPEAWTAIIQRARVRFRCKREISAGEEKGIVTVLASTVADEVALHWELMDEVRKETSDRREPFSINLWDLYGFFRAVLAEASDLIWMRSQDVAKNEDGLLLCTPMFRRFPVSFGPLVRALSNLAYRQGSLSQIHDGGILGLRLVNEAVGLGSSLTISPNAHACLICCEGMLERLVWGSGWFISAAHRSNRSADVLNTVNFISNVVSAVEIIRLPGGDCGESELVARRRAGAIGDTLQETCKEKRISRRQADDWRLSGLLAAALCGISCGSQIEGWSAFSESLDAAESEELRRAAWKSLQLSAVEQTGHARAEALTHNVCGARVSDRSNAVGERGNGILS